MKLNEVIQRLSPFDQGAILVTGPQRSGTTIATQILADSLKATPILEEQFNTEDTQAFRELIPRLPGVSVIQAPALCHLAHRLPVIGVVFVWRDNAQIEASVNRINWWPYNGRELEKYKIPSVGKRYPKSWEIKKKVFVKQQMPYIDMALILEYESMTGHRLFIPSTERRTFLPRQTTK